MTTPYKTSTFITSLFCKFRVRDKGIRKQITDLYAPIIDSVLQNFSSTQRIIVFRKLLPVIQETISYLDSGKESVLNSHIDVLKSSIEFSCYLINQANSSNWSPNNSFEYIMKQVNLDDIACEIGDCLASLRKISSNSDRDEILSRLDVLLTDYNVVTQQSLTVEDLLVKVGIGKKREL